MDSPPLVRRIVASVLRLVRKFAVIVLVVVLAVVGLRAWQSTQGPPLRPWHKIVPAELSAHAIVRGDWRSYIAAEDRMFDQLHRDLQRKMDPDDLTPLSRYNDASRASPIAFGDDWNRSHVLEPVGELRGVVVLLHGLSDGPYSMRSIAELYRQHGFIAIVPRLPGHGTVPAGLTREGREEWNATVEMTMAEARRRAGGKLPVHLVGYSNGAALAMLHVMRRIQRGESSDVARVVLLSPMVEVNAFARYAGLAGLPALMGRYAKAAWLDLLPEFNPFKYNSFPVRAARESYLVTSDLRAALDAVAAQGAMAKAPPILAFQSVVDDTVSAPAVMTRLFDRFAANGSELVLFDVNRNRAMAPILRASATDWSRDALRITPRRYTLTIVGNASADDATAVARSLSPGATAVQETPTGLRYPDDVYSLSHIAVPFPPDDAVYGNVPSTRRILQLGTVAVRGERNTLEVSQDALNRLSWNPFHAYVRTRIAETVPR